MILIVTVRRSIVLTGQINSTIVVIDKHTKLSELAKKRLVCIFFCGDYLTQIPFIDLQGDFPTLGLCFSSGNIFVALYIKGASTANRPWSLTRGLENTLGLFFTLKISNMIWLQ